MKAQLIKPKPKVIQMPTGTKDMKVGMTIAQTDRQGDGLVRVDPYRVWVVVEICDTMSQHHTLNGLLHVIAKYEHVDYFGKPTGKVSYVMFLGNTEDQHWWIADTMNAQADFRKKLYTYQRQNR